MKSIRRVIFLMLAMVLSVCSGVIVFADEGPNSAIHEGDMWYVDQEDFTGSFDEDLGILTVDTVKTPNPIAFYDPNKSTALQGDSWSNKVISIVWNPTSAPERAFEKFINAERIKCPNITTFTGKEFVQAVGLKTISFNEDMPNATNISDGMFADLTNLETVHLGNITTIGNNAFRGCTKLRIVDNGSKVTSIGEAAFKACESLQSITLSTSLSTIGNEAFSGCTTLAAVPDMANVVEVGDEAFYGCDNLSNNSAITFNKHVIIGTSAFEGAFSESGKNILNFNDGVEFGISSFENSYVRSINLNNKATNIPDKAFKDSKVEKVQGAEGIALIGNSAFEGCGNLVELNPGVDLTYLGTSAFKDCKMYTATWNNLNTSLTSIPLDCFVGSGIVGVDLTNVKSIGANAFRNTRLEWVGNVPLQFTSVGDYAFAGIDGSPASDLVTMSIAQAGNGLFKDSSLLSKASISIDKMDDLIFQNNINLSEIELSSADGTIPAQSFKGCVSLNSVKLVAPTSTDISYDVTSAFKGLSKLKTVEGKIGKVGVEGFKDCIALISITLNNCTSIANNAFDGCYWLKEVDLSKIESIGANAFVGCDDLSKIVVSDDFVENNNHDWYSAFTVTNNLRTQLNVSDIDIDEFQMATNRVIGSHTINVTASYNGNAIFRDPDTNRAVAPDKNDFTVTVIDNYLCPGEDEVDEDQYKEVSLDLVSIDSTKFESGASDSVDLTYTSPKTVGFTGEQTSKTISVKVRTTGDKQPVSKEYNRLRGSYERYLNDGDTPDKKFFNVYVIYDAVFNDGTTGEWEESAKTTDFQMKDSVLEPTVYPYTDYTAVWTNPDDGVEHEVEIRVVPTCLHPEDKRQDCDVELPTCTEDGSKSQKCTLCGEVIPGSYTVIDKLGHDPINGVHTDREDDPDHYGFTTYDCSRCGEKLKVSDADLESNVRLKLYYNDVEVRDDASIFVKVGENIIPDDFRVDVSSSIKWADGSVTNETRTLKRDAYTLKLNGNSFTEAFDVVEGTIVVVAEVDYLNRSYELSCSLYGTTDTVFTITGTMKDHNAEVLSGYVAYLDSVDNEVVVDSATGRYQFTEVPVGQHRVYFASKKVTSLGNAVEGIVYSVSFNASEEGVINNINMNEANSSYSVEHVVERTVLYLNLKERGIPGHVYGTWKDKNGASYTGRYIFMDSLSRNAKVASDGSWSFSDVMVGNHTLYLTNLTSVPTVSMATNGLGIDDANIIDTLEIVTNYTGTSTVVETTLKNTKYTVINETKDLYIAFSENDTRGKATVSGTIKNYVNTIKNTLYFVDTTTNQFKMPTDGYYYVGDLIEGDHAIYFTAKTSMADIDTTKTLAENSYLVLYVTVDTSGNCKFKSSNINYSSNTKYTEDKKENGNSLTVNYTFGEKEPEGPVIVTEGARFSGSLSSKNGLFANRVILLDSYDNWTIADASGSFYFDEVSVQGTHYLYICKNVKSKLLAESGAVRADEPVFTKIEIVMRGDQMTPSIHSDFSEDYVSHTYSWSPATYSEDPETGLSKKTADATLSFTINDNSTQPTTKEGVDLNGTLSSDNFNVTSKVALLDNYDNWTIMTSDGAFGFSEIGEGNHTLYLTKVTRSNLKRQTGPVASNEEILATFTFTVEAGVFKNIAINESEDTVSWSYKLTTALDVLDLTIKDATKDVVAKPAIQGTVTGDNARRYTGHAVLVDTYDNWTTIDSSGYFSMNNIEDGDHTVYVTNSKKSDLKRQSGDVSSAESCLIKIRLLVENGMVTSTSVIETGDMVFMKYTLKDNLVTYDIIDDTEYQNEYTSKASVTGRISGEENERYTSRTVLLDNYNNWVTIDSSGNFSFDGIDNGTHILYVTKNKHSELRHNSGGFDEKEPCYIKIRLVVKDNKIESTSIIEAEDDITMKYEIKDNSISYEITDAKTYESKTSEDDKKDNDKGNGNGDSSTEDVDTPVVFSVAYVHDNRPATGCYIFLDDILTNKAIPNNGFQYIWIPEGVHTLYITAVDPGQIVLSGADLSTSKYLLYQLTLDNQDGHILSVIEDKAVKGSIHNLKLSPQLNSLGLAMVTVSPVTTAVDLGNGIAASGAPADSMVTTDASTSTTTTTTNSGTTTTTTTTVEEEETFSIGNTDIVTSSLPQTGYDYLMTVGAENGLVTLDENANAYLDVAGTIDIVKRMDTPEAKEFVSMLNLSYIKFFGVCGSIFVLLIAAIFMLSYSKRNRAE